MVENSNNHRDLGSRRRGRGTKNGRKEDAIGRVSTGPQRRPAEDGATGLGGCEADSPAMPPRTRAPPPCRARLRVGSESR